MFLFSTINNCNQHVESPQQQQYRFILTETINSKSTVLRYPINRKFPLTVESPKLFKIMKTIIIFSFTHIMFALTFIIRTTGILYILDP